MTARAYYLRGVAALQSSHLQQALHDLGSAWRLDAEQADHGVQYAKALSLTEHSRCAVNVASRTLDLAPRTAMDWDTLGVVFIRAQAFSQARVAFGEATRRNPEHAAHHYNLASTLMTLGDSSTAARELRECLQREPRHWAAHWALAQLGDRDRACEHIRQIESLLPEIRGVPQDLAPACVALSREYEQMGTHAKAFEYLQAGKAAGKQVIRYDVSRDEKLFSAITKTFEKPPRITGADDSNEPIFVLGMPRSGTTLAERILSSHPDVYSTGEIQNFPMMMKQLSGVHSRRLLDQETILALGKHDWGRLGRRYVDSTRPTTGKVRHFIDKLPHNFLNIGFIAASLPNARIICMRRHPMDTCLGNFRQLFMLGSHFCDYSFDLLDIGRYYVMFHRLMARWHELFPGRILEVSYEELVRDQEAESRRMLEHCGLAWNPRCLEFQSNPLPVDSASAVQVRKGIHKGALRRWKTYRQQLVDLERLLWANGIDVSG